MILITYLLLSIIVGVAGKEKRIGFIGAFLLSLILSPLIGIIAVLISKDLDR